MQPQKFLNHIFLIIFILFSICASSQKINVADIVNKRFEYMNQHNVSQIASLYNDSAKIQSPNFEGFKVGVAGATEIFSRYFTSSPNLSYKISRTIVCNNSAIIEFASSGTMDSLEKNTPSFMKGKSYTLLNCTILDFKNGKIIKEVDYFDQVSFLRQMDYFNQQH
ncbi:MAG: nuclear transport factor 2 family protein [Chitinophagaceae bacterium]